MIAHTLEEFLDRYQQGSLGAEHIVMANEQLMLYSGPGKSISSWIGEIITFSDAIITPYSASHQANKELAVMYTEGILHKHRHQKTPYTKEHLNAIEQRIQEPHHKPALIHAGPLHGVVDRLDHLSYHSFSSLQTHRVQRALKQTNKRKTTLYIDALPAQNIAKILDAKSL